MNTGKEHDKFMSNNEREKYLKTHPIITQLPSIVAVVGDHIMGVGPKVDGGFNENMQRIAAAHPNSPLADKFGGSTVSHKEIKTRNAINKHAKEVKRSGWSANKNPTK
tara:strand:+ start:147 stop:470 length:324 start_codon:yes stop_codon:yes gene_type:complete